MTPLGQDPDRFAASCPVCGDELRTRSIPAVLQWLAIMHRHTAVEHAAAFVVKRSVES